MNRLNQALYDELKFDPASVIQRHNFIISSTELNYAQYGLAQAQGQNSMAEHLAALGIPAEEFSAVGAVKVLRCTVMNPWLALSRDGHPDYGVAFAEVLQQTIERLVSAQANC